MAGINTISGKYLTAVINSNQVVRGLQEWSATETSDQLDGTTGLDNGFENDDDGVKRVEVDMTLVLNLATGVYSPLTSGSLITNLALYRSSTDGQPAFLIPLFKVYRAVQAGRVKDRFTVQVSGRSKGPYTTNDPTAE